MLVNTCAVPQQLALAIESFHRPRTRDEEIKRLLWSTRLLTFTGPGGCGKTRLAVQVASDLLDAFSDGVWLIELALLIDPALVPQAIVTTFSLKEHVGRTQAMGILAALAAIVLITLQSRLNNGADQQYTMSRQAGSGALRHCA